MGRGWKDGHEFGLGCGEVFEGVGKVGIRVERGPVVAGGKVLYEGVFSGPVGGNRLCEFIFGRKDRSEVEGDGGSAERGVVEQRGGEGAETALLDGSGGWI